MSKKYFIGFLMTVGMIFLLSACGKTTINLNDYLIVKYDGYDTIGTASWWIDQEKLFTDNAKAFKLNDKNGSGYMRLAALSYNFSGKLSETENLENGDKIEFHWRNNLAALEENYKVQFTYEDPVLTVSGLQEPEAYDPFSDLKYSFSGYDTVGVLETSANTEIDGIYIEADRYDGLKNGDKVTFTVSSRRSDPLDTVALKQGKKLTATEKTVEVSGLTPLQDYDPFTDVEVSFSGTAPDGKAEVNYTGELNLWPNTSYYSNLRNGDRITVELQGSDSERAAKQGFRLTGLSKEYEVSGLPFWAGSYDEIPAETLENMEQKARDVLKDYTTANWEKVKLSEMELMRTYFLTPKPEPDYGTDNNKLYFFFKIKAVDPDLEEPVEYYYYTGFKNILVMADGTASVDLSDFSRPEGSWGWGSVNGEAFVRGEYFYTGYEELDSMIYNVISERAANYDYVIIEGDQKTNVSGEMHYAAKLEEIPHELLDKLDQKSQKIKYDATAANENAWPIDSMEWIRTYLLTNKTGSRSDEENIVYLFYKIKKHDPETEDQVEYYYYYRFRNIMIMPDDFCSVDISDYKEPDGGVSWGSVYGEAFIYDDNHCFAGYEDLDSMVYNTISKKAEEYNSEMTEK